MDKVVCDILSCVPKFILEDRNGYAIARTMNVLINQLCEDIACADALLTDPSQMPEWALDEYAYSNGMTWYDKSASVEIKRRWAQEAQRMRLCVGTKAAICQMLEGRYEQCYVEEGWQYGGEPYHFRVTVSGSWDKTGVAWMKKTVEAVKNLRSVMDGVSLGGEAHVEVRGEGAAIARARFPMCGEFLSGQWPGS